MKQINIDQLAGVLSNLPTDTDAILTTETVPQMRKSGNPYAGEITKRTVAHVSLNYKYEKEVNRKLALEGKEIDFEAKNRKWGSHLGNTPLITKDGKLYLDVQFKSVVSSEYLHNGQPIDKELLESYLPAAKNTGDKQGLQEENAIIVRSYKIGSVRSIEIKGHAEPYEII